MTEKNYNRIKVFCLTTVFALVFSCVFILPLSPGEYKNTHHLITSVPFISQSGSYPTGCEVVAATMVLQYYGYPYTVDQMIDGYLDIGSYTFESGRLVADDPNEMFIGNPRATQTFGCYAPVIARMMNKVLSGQTAYVMYDMSLEDISMNFIDKDIPVLVWVTINMREPAKTTPMTIRGTGRTMDWIDGEHCMVLVGHDEDNYYFNDPYQSYGKVSYPKEVAEQRYALLGSQAVVIK